jgi:hypothetical protein
LDKGSNNDGGKVAIRRATVFVSTKSLMDSQPVVVLSAAVSSRERISKDRNDAMTLAHRLDVKNDIPLEARIKSILKILFPNKQQDGDGDSEKDAQRAEDMLDVTIAYLRRVHLFSFYNGCTSSNNVANVLAGQHPAGSIHLRLKNADDILKKTREETADIYDDLPLAENAKEEGSVDPEAQNTVKDVTAVVTSQSSPAPEAKDMLVMRLDDSIAKALEATSSIGEYPSPFIVNETVDAIASEIEAKEEHTKKEWVDNHAMIDADGRARCSFHFCRKLFKDKSFLQKHLLKKHPAFLKGEVAKCHDAYMMQWWDEEVYRPVPQIQVDCGSLFGILPSTVVGSTNPTAHDPEPALWEKEQERRRLEEEQQEKYRQQQAADLAEKQRRYNESNNNRQNDGNEHFHPTEAKSTYMDVDDMKDEKVELSFENVDVVTPSSKKKKKKKKLL